jgi:hypothetical protein
MGEQPAEHEVDERALPTHSDQTEEARNKTPIHPDWWKQAEPAIEKMGNFERSLLLRIAEARGQRVPMSELVTALSLPSKPDLAHDFPTLTNFCSQPGSGAPGGYEMPVVTGGSDADDSYYWMSLDDSVAFIVALRKATAGPSSRPE